MRPEEAPPKVRKATAIIATVTAQMIPNETTVTLLNFSIDLSCSPE